MGADFGIYLPTVQTMKRHHLTWTIAFAFAFAFLLALAGVASRAQQPVATKGKAAKAPTAPPGINWPSPPLPDGPIVLDTGIQHQIRLMVTKGLNQPFSMA